MIGKAEEKVMTQRTSGAELLHIIFETTLSACR